MKTPALLWSNRWLNRIGFPRILMLVLIIALGGLVTSSAAITSQERVQLVRQWAEFADLSDDAIVELLDTDSGYDGIPFKEWVDYSFTATDLMNAARRRDLHDFTEIAVNFGLNKGVKKLIENTVFESAFAVANLASWPIKYGLNNFADTVLKKPQQNQLKLYYGLRDAGYSHEQIMALSAGDQSLIPANLTNVPRVAKTEDGWLARDPPLGNFLYFGTNVTPSPPITPSALFAWAEAQYDALHVIPQKVAVDQARLRALMLRASKPEAPQITTQPSGGIISAGNGCWMSVDATGTEPLHYLWRHDGAIIANHDYSFYTAHDGGEYTVEVSNTLGSVTSDPATVEVRGSETISFTAPASGATIGDICTVQISAPDATRVVFFLDGEKGFIDSTAPFSWPWDTAESADGPHTLQAEAFVGDSQIGTSISVSVTVNNATTFPDADEHEPNDSSLQSTVLGFGTAAQGRISSPRDVDWFKVDVATPGMLTFDLSVPTNKDYDLELYGPDALYIKGSYGDTSLPENITCNATIAGTYYVRVYGYPVGSGSFSPTDSYSLTTNLTSGAITMTASPQSTSVPWGSSATFSATATCGTNSSLTYQWMRDTVDIPGATNATYSTPPTTLAQDGDKFSVRVTGEFGSITSSAATLTVTDPPSNNWTGAISQDWSEPANWDLGHIPNGSEVVRISGGQVNFTGGWVSGNIVISGGTLTWSGGTIAGNMTIAEDGVLILTGSEEKRLDGGTLNNAGTVTWAGTGALNGFNATINNLAGGLFDIQSDAALGAFDHYANYSYYILPNTLTNAGTLRKSGGTGETTITSYWQTPTNTGTIEVLSGTLAFYGGYTNDGTINVASGATVSFRSGTFTARAGSALNAASGATLNYQYGGFVYETGSSVSGTPTNRITGSASFTGDVNLPNLELATGGWLSGTFTLHGNLTWSGGTIAGNMTIAEDGVLILTGSEEKRLDGGTLNNAGTVTWAGTGALNGFNATINNLAGGLFDIQSDAALGAFDHYANYSYYILPNTLTNAGTLRKSGGTGETTITSYWQVPTNTGTIEVLNGTLAFQGGYTNDGTISISTGARLDVNGNILFPPKIAEQPQDRAATIGANLTFEVAMIGNPLPVGQWQMSSDNGNTWTDLSDTSPYNGVTTDTLSITGVTMAMSGYVFRCIVTSAVGSDVSDSAMLVVRTPLAAWRELHFGTDSAIGAAADFADPDVDNRCNLLEYALGTDPHVSDSNQGMSMGTALDAQGMHLTLTFTRVADPALIYRVEASVDLVEWTSIWVSTGAENLDGQVDVTDPTVVLQTQPVRFLRLNVSY
jgi:hypothetical protein